MVPRNRYFIIEHLALFDRELPQTPEEIIDAAKRNELVWLFEERVLDMVQGRGQVQTGPRQVHCQAISSSYLVELVHDVPLSLLSGEYSTVRLADGVIFHAGSEVLHVFQDYFDRLTGEVVLDVFSRRHLDEVPDFEAELFYRMVKFVADRYAESEAIGDANFCNEYVSLLKKHPEATLTWTEVEAAAEAALQYYYCLPSIKEEV